MQTARISPWSFDLIDDTCPGTGCVGDPTLYLMDAITIPPGTPHITPGQAHVMLRHVFVSPGRAFFTPGAVFGASPLLAAARLTGVTCASCPAR